MMNKIPVLAGCFLSLLIIVFPAHAQGGKAEPKRIEFKPGTVSALLSGTLSNGQEMDYVFAAKAGQVIKVTNRTNGLFDFRIFRDEAGVETEFESSRTLTVDLPQSGDYLFFVRKKQVKAPRSGRYSINIEIK